MSLEFGNDREACNVVGSGSCEVRLLASNPISAQYQKLTALALHGSTSVSWGLIGSTLFTPIDSEFKKCF